MKDERGDGLDRKNKLTLGRKVLRDQIKDYLVAAILRGSYGAGDRIVETRIAQQLGVSQGAVREALREMEWMGFLESKPYSGTYVRDISSKDLQEIYPVRAVLEALGARLAVFHLTDSQLDKMQNLIDEMVRVSKEGDERGMVERNFAFHKTIIHASQNSTLIRSWSMFQFSYWTSISTAELHNDLVNLAERHYKILEALRSRDPEKAAQEAKEHIEELIERLSHREPHSVTARTKSESSVMEVAESNHQG